MTAPWIDLHRHFPCRNGSDWKESEDSAVFSAGNIPDSENMVQVGNILCSSARGKQLDPRNAMDPAVPWKYFTAGVHPKDAEEAGLGFALLENLLSDPRCIAVGECGLDRLIAGDLRGQKNLFIRQAELAEEQRKPLIIHAVRTHDELLRIRKEIRPESPWILHGFRGGERKTFAMLDAGLYLSFGQGILRDAANMESFFCRIPAERIFCETDESNESIQRIYAQTASLLLMSEMELRCQIVQNFENCFHRSV